MKTELINNLANAAAEALKEAIHEAAIEIGKDYEITVAEAHESGAEKLPPLKLSFAIAFDPGSKAADFDLKWTVAKKRTTSTQIDDPDQPGLFPKPAKK
jgi:hypothetical protein